MKICVRRRKIFSNDLTNIAEIMMTGVIPHTTEIYLSDIGTVAIIPDPNIDRDGWAYFTHPFQHLRMGLHVWEDFRTLPAIADERAIAEVFMRER